MRRFAIRVLLLASPAILGAQELRPLGKPDAEFPEPISRVVGIRELKDGRVLASDEREDALRLVDFATSRAAIIGRHGEGPREYGYAGRLVAIPGDRGADRFPGASDARGNLYFESSPVTVMRGGAPNFPLDSTAITRFDRTAQRLDTVAFVQLDKANVEVRANTRGTSTRFGVLAFPSRDDWVVFPDGGVAVVRVRTYHIDRYSATGMRTSGPPVRTTPVIVDDVEKEAWRAERRGTMVSRSDGPAAPTSPREPVWQKVKPPFVYWSSHARPNGEVWVLRSHAASSKPVYDVFDAASVLVRRVELPARSRLIGFGTGTLYLVVRDDDDLEHLKRYRVP